MSTYRFRVDEVRSFSYPNGIKRLMVEVPIGNLPSDFPTDVNAREQNLRSAVARAIKRSLEEEGKPEIFHLLNRGIVLSAASAEFDSTSRTLTVDLPDSDYHGVLDGGHTYKIVTSNADRAPSARVLLEILLGVEDFQADIVGARNTSVQVDEVSLANVRHEFEHLLDWLDKHGVPRTRIKVRQNEDKDVPILDILTIMYLFDVDTFGNGLSGTDTPPVLAYSGRGSVVKHVRLNEENQKRYFDRMLPLLPDILYLWDYTALRLQDHYRAAGREEGRVGRRRGNKAQDTYGDYMTHLKLERIPHRAYRLPLMAALRCLVDNRGPCYGWYPVDLPDVDGKIRRQLRRPATPVERLYESVAIQMHKILWPEAEKSTPTRLGKSAPIWNNLYMLAWRALQSHIPK